MEACSGESGGSQGKVCGIIRAVSSRGRIGDERPRRLGPVELLGQVLEDIPGVGDELLRQFLALADSPSSVRQVRLRDLLKAAADARSTS